MHVVSSSGFITTETLWRLRGNCPKKKNGLFVSTFSDTNSLVDFLAFLVELNHGDDDHL